MLDDGTVPFEITQITELMNVSSSLMVLSLVRYLPLYRMICRKRALYRNNSFCCHVRDVKVNGFSEKGILMDINKVYMMRMDPPCFSKTRL